MPRKSLQTAGHAGGLVPPRAGFQLVEASAGTGKTYNLTSQYLLLLLHNALTVDQILVITFTVAATAELRDRIRSRLRQTRDALESGAPGRLGDAELQESLEPFFTDPVGRAAALERLTVALASFDEAAIFTIHGFCTRILGEQAFVSGTNFELEVMQEDLDLLETVVADFVRTRFDRLTVAEYSAFTGTSVLVDFGGARAWEAPGTLMSAERLRTLRRLISDPFLQIVPEGPKRRTKGGMDPQEMELILTRELIYTALTRARRRITVCGRAEVIRAAVERRIRRASGLRDALWGRAPEDS